MGSHLAQRKRRLHAADTLNAPAPPVVAAAHPGYAATAPHMKSDAFIGTRNGLRGAPALSLRVPWTRNDGTP